MTDNIVSFKPRPTDPDEADWDLITGWLAEMNDAELIPEPVGRAICRQFFGDELGAPEQDPA
jgi:hypothetical protein